MPQFSFPRIKIPLFAFSLLLIFSLITTVTSAQVKTISGTVKDSSGAPVADVSVTVQKSTSGSKTNSEGYFTISAPLGSTLVFSSVNFEPVSEIVNERTDYNIVMKSLVTSMSDVVVVGYGTQRKRDVTGSVASVPKERLQQLPNTNIAQALQGSVPGLQINTNGGGAEGNEVSILIRGKNSISASNSPLIIWDGIPYEGGISEINVNDVESIEILKDASATAIYGSRGSNGVILVTSKQGRKGKLNITYDGFVGTQSLTNKPDLLTGEEFYQFKKSRLNAVNTITAAEQAIYDAGEWVNWYDLATQTGTRSQHSLSIAGGSDKIRFYFGGTVLDVKGVSVNDRFKRYSLRPNLEIKVTPWLTVGSSTQFSYQNRDGLPVEFFDERNTGGGANFFNPLTKPYDSTGKPAIYAYQDNPQARNPLSSILVANTNNAYRIFTANNIKIDIPFIKGLFYKLNTGVEYENNQRKTYYGRNVARGFESNGNAINFNSIQRNITVENILNYSREFGKHSINLTALYSSQRNDYDEDQLEGRGFPNDVLTNYQMSAATLLTPTADYFKQSLVSQMGRLNYGYDGKYLVTFTTRRDGYSGFGANTKYGVFPTVALAWNIYREDFMSGIGFLSNLKLRASYGRNGNQAVSSYSSMAKLSSALYVSGATALPGYLPSSLANEELGWESTKSLTIGMDFGLFNNRIQGTIDYYSAKTADLLLNRAISSVQGFTNVLQNIGKTANKGLEIGINSTNIRTPQFSWTTGINASYNKNKIVDLYGDGNDDIGNSWFIGQPIDVIYGYKEDGIFRSQAEVDASAQPTAQPGWIRVNNVNKDNVINADDRVIIGKENPDLVWGITNTVKYRELSLMFFFHGVTGVTKRNQFRDDDVFSDIRRNTTQKDWWTPDNTNASHYANDAKANPYNVNFYEKAGFARLKDVSLAYDFSKRLVSKMKISGLKLYVTGRNLATITKYDALDPELTDQYGLPLQKEFIFGLTLSF